MPHKICLCIHKILHSYQTALQSADEQPLASLPSAFISGSLWFKPTVSVKVFDFELVTMLGFFYAAVKESDTETLRSVKNQTHFWTCFW